MAISGQQVEHVLTVPTALFEEIGRFNGFCGDIGRYLPTLLDPAWTSYQPRDAVEEDPSYKQLIPYCIFRHDGKVFYYQRGTQQGEARLHAKISVGVGGHISSLDESGQGSAYEEGMAREIEEEVFLDSTYEESCIGIINDDTTDVGRVHLGVVHLFELDKPKVQPREQSMMNTGFAHPAELVQDRDDFESWSQICLDFLLQNA